VTEAVCAISLLNDQCALKCCTFKCFTTLMCNSELMLLHRSNLKWHMDNVANSLWFIFAGSHNHIHNHNNNLIT